MESRVLQVLYFSFLGFTRLANHNSQCWNLKATMFNDSLICFVHWKNFVIKQQTSTIDIHMGLWVSGFGTCCTTSIVIDRVQGALWFWVYEATPTCLGMWTTLQNYVWCKFYRFELMFGFLDSNFVCSLGFLALWLNVQLLIEFISFWFGKLLFNFVGLHILQVFRVFGFIDFWLHELGFNSIVLLIFRFMFCWGFLTL
jgi:hypothetical protein